MKRKVQLFVYIAVLILAVSLVGVVVNYWLIVDQKNSELASKDILINDLHAKIADDNRTIVLLKSEVTSQGEEIQNLSERNSQLQTWLSDNVTMLDAQIDELQSNVSQGQKLITNFEEQISILNTEIDTLNFQSNNLWSKITEFSEILSLYRIRSLQTLVFHVCEKDWIQIPDVTATYGQLMKLFGGHYGLYLYPEYPEQQNWTQNLTWLNASFGGPHGIPIMLHVFGGGEGTAPTPMLSISEIEDALAVANVRYLAFGEVISWHIENNQPFPIEYVTQVIEFAKDNGLQVFWSEWKNDFPPDDMVFQAIQTYIQGYENTVIVSFSTNSGELEPGAAFLYLDDTFKHWGASVQSWYWNTHTGENPADMPASLLVQHTLIASYVGAEIVEFEPYWYFFDGDGQPTENLMLLHALLFGNREEE